MINTDNFVFFDVETTGLNVLRHNILELSYAIGGGEIKTLYLPDYSDVFATADPRAMEVNKYFERFAGEGYGQWYLLPSEFIGKAETHNGIPCVYLALPVSEPEEWDKFFEVIEGKTLVGANPGFDRAFLEVYNNGEPLRANHRLFDVQAFCAGRLYANVLNTHGLFSFGVDQEAFDAWVKFPSLRNLCIDFNVEPGDHTSAEDVRATRAVWKHLVGLA